MIAGRLLSLISLLAALVALVVSTLERRAPGRIPIVDLIRDRFRPPRGSDLLWGAAAGVLVVVVPFIVFLAKGWLVVHRNDFAAAALLFPLVATLLIKIAWAAAEELIYRGAVLPQIAGRSSAAIALIVSSILFAFAHLERAGGRAPAGLSMAVYLLDGIGFGVAWLATRSLWVPSAWHGAKNVTIWLLYGSNTFQLSPGVLRSDVTGPALWTGAPGQAGVVDLLVTSIIVALVIVICRRRLAGGSHTMR